MSKETEYKREYREKKRILAMTQIERIEEYFIELHKTQLKKFLNINKIESEATKQYKELAEIRQDLRSGKIDSKIATALIKDIDSARGILRELRLTLGFLNKEQARLQFELERAENEKKWKVKNSE